MYGGANRGPGANESRRRNLEFLVAPLAYAILKSSMAMGWPEGDDRGEPMGHGGLDGQWVEGLSPVAHVLHAVFFSLADIKS